jgi:hypothetical protein
MTPFQAILKKKLNQIVRDYNASIIFNLYDCEPNDLIGHKEDDVYIEASIEMKILPVKGYF